MRMGHWEWDALDGIHALIRSGRQRDHTQAQRRVHMRTQQDGG